MSLSVNSDKFKDITFKSTKIEKGADAGTLKVTGDLTIHGVTKPITLDVSEAPGVQVGDAGRQDDLVGSFSFPGT